MNESDKNLILGIWDDGGASVDRYTVVYKIPYYSKRTGDTIFYECLAMSHNPFHPRGFCQNTMAKVGDHLGEKIDFEQLPEDCKKAIEANLDDVGDYPV